MNKTELNKEESYHNLSILIPLFFVLFLLLLWLLYCLRSGLLQRSLNWIGICPDYPNNLRDPLLEGNVTWKRREDFLIKRCDQETTRNVEDRIIGRLQREYNVVERPWNKNLDDGQHPVIVFCVISSRIGTDIENAMRGVNGKSPVVLVLLHCVLSALLRGDLSDDEELLDPEMKKRMTGITHFAFSDREGLYSCHQNTVGFEQLIDIVRSLDG